MKANKNLRVLFFFSNFSLKKIFKENHKFSQRNKT